MKYYHLNLLYQSFPSQRMVQGRLMLKEFASLFKHNAGIDNDSADTLTCLDMIEKLSDTIKWEEILPHLQYTKSNIKHSTNQYSCHNFVTMEFNDDMFNANDKVVEHDDDKTCIINKKNTDCEFLLNVRMFKVH